MKFFEVVLCSTILFFSFFSFFLSISSSLAWFCFSQIRDFVAEQMSLRGINFHTEESPQAIIKSADGSLSLKMNKETVNGFSHVMFATGRRPNTKV